MLNSYSQIPKGFPLLFLISLLVFAACDSGDPGTYEEEIVVEGYLEAGAPFEPVRLSRTLPLNQQYAFQAVQDAEVRVDLLDANGAVEVSYPYRMAADEPGVYRAVDEAARVEPLRTYRLEASVPGSDRITATTVVPDTFSVVGASNDSLVYQSTEQLQLRVTRSRVPGRDQTYFIFVTEALDAREEQLTPFAKALFENQDGELTIEDLRLNGAPILNESNYDANADGTLTIKVPWLAIVFYGPNRLIANAIDDNLYDFIRSQSVQQGGSTFAPGEIPNVLERLEGARGVFGSYARIQQDLFVRRADAG